MMPSVNKLEILADNHRHLFPGRVDRMGDGGIDFVPDRREGYRYWDFDGREIFDLHLNGGTFNLGHCHPELVKTLQEASARWDIGNHHFPSEPKARLAKSLIEATPGDMRYVVFTPSGGEANDVAIKSARYVTGHRKIVALDAGYHGRTGLSGAAGDDAMARLFNSDYPSEFIKVPFDDLLAMEDALQSGDVALVMMETLPATYGFPIPSDGYLPGVKSLCEKYGTMFLADEVQTGLGRTGHRWAIEAWDVKPDFLVTGKGLSGGIYPMAAVVMTEKCGSWLNDHGWGHVSTFGGSDLGCIVSLKALELSLAPATLANVNEQASYLRKRLEQTRERFPFLVAIRQKGLVFGLQFDRSATTWMMVRALYENGVWAMIAAFDETVLQFKPGLLIDKDYCDELMDRFTNACIWYVNNANALIMESVQDDAAIDRAMKFAAAALPQWGLSDATVELIKHRENTVFKVTTDHGSSFALRLHRRGYHGKTSLESELDWMKGLTADGIPTPAAIPATDGQRVVSVSLSETDGTKEPESRNCTLLAWVDGSPFDHLGRVERGVIAELKDRYRQLGALAGRLHNQGQQWQPPDSFQRHRWDIDALLGENPLWGCFWNHPLLSKEQRLSMIKAKIVLTSLLKQLGTDPNCYGLIHADFLPENILVEDGNLHLIDFDDCGYGWYMFEMATSLFPKIAEPYWDDLVDEYVAGYRSEREFSDEHLSIFPAFVLLRGFTYLGWLMTRAEGLKNRDKLAREIIDGLCDHIPELLNELTATQRWGVNVLAWWQSQKRPDDTKQRSKKWHE